MKYLFNFVYILLLTIIVVIGMIIMYIILSLWHLKFNPPFPSEEYYLSNWKFTDEVNYLRAEWFDLINTLFKNK